MPFADPNRVIAKVYATINRPSQEVLPVEDVQAFRVDAGMEILRSISRSPQNGHFGELATLVGVAHNSFLPGHEGELGIPFIVPYAGADAREGIPSSPDEIDAYRLNPSSFTGAVDGIVVAHDQQGADGKMSPLACRYSFANQRFKFTGVSAQIPMIQPTRSMADTSIPENYEPTLVKLIIPRAVKPGTPFFQAAQMFRADGLQDLVAIEKGELVVKPLRSVPKIEEEQKQAT